MLIFISNQLSKIFLHMWDTTDFLQKLDRIKNIPNDCLLVTLDSTSLYTNIPNNERIKAVRKAYDKHPSKTVETKEIVTFFSLILTLNNFVFNSLNYLQIIRYPMGTICASVYANIFMAQFEKQYIHIYIKNISIPSLQYIDDIFMIWTGIKQDVLVFSENSNNKHKTIKFEYTISHSNISFLETLIYKDKNNTLQTTLYRNPLISDPFFMHIQTIQRHLKKEYRIARCWGSKSSVPH